MNKPPTYYDGIQTPNYGSTDQLNNSQHAAHSDRFEYVQRAKYHDLWATILFYLHFAAFIALSGFGISKGINLDTPSNGTTTGTTPATSGQVPNNAIANFSVILVVSSLVAAGLTAFWMLLVKCIPRQLIHVTFVLGCIVWFAVSVVNFLSGIWLAGVLTAIIAVINVIFYFMVRKRIPFSALILETVAMVGSKYPASYFFTLLNMVIALGFQVWWAFGVIALTSYFQRMNYSGVLAAVVIFMVFSFYWTTQVLRNTLYVTISGTIASWYFLFGTAAMPKHPTLGAAKRAFSSSFGPICFGSLLIALVQLLRYLVQSAARDDSMLACIADCILACLQGLLEYFNDKALIYVAMYGKSFCQSAKDVFNILQSHGINMIINDSLIGPVVGIGALLVGAISGGIAGVWAFLLYKDSMDVAMPYVVGIALICFFIGVMMMSIVGMFIDAGSGTLFICIAEEPMALQRTKPELFAKLQELYPQAIWRS